MIVFRTITSNELLELINNLNIEHYTIKGQNTFHYDNFEEYIHFFKYEKHALHWMKKLSNPIIMKLDIPDDLLGNIEYGFYPYIKTKIDDSLYFLSIPLPEYIINKKNFKKDYIIDFSYNCIWQNQKQIIPKELVPIYVERNSILGKCESQWWHIEDVYYEYIKNLLQTYNYDMKNVIDYLKSIDLDIEIEKMKNKIITEKNSTKKRTLKHRKIIDI